jgi:DNA-binding HxlR family transcriptional regulator
VRGEKWSSLLVNALADGPRRHAELRGVVAGISQKVLTQTLRVLERDGLVSRTVIPDVPVQVSYRLTGLGKSLLPVLQALKNWSEANIEAIMAARDAYDSRAA